MRRHKNLARAEERRHRRKARSTENEVILNAVPYSDLDAVICVESEVILLQIFHVRIPTDQCIGVRCTKQSRVRDQLHYCECEGTRRI